MNYLSLREVQMEQLELLKEFIQLCDEHKLEYFVMGGTLLGTIRHQGFIPWDDDIDVLMIRPEYDKLISLIENGSIDTEKYHFIGAQINNGLHPFLKMINPKIKVHEEIEVDKNLWLDIFPYDGIPTKEDELKKFLKSFYYKCQLYNVMIMSWNGVLHSSKHFNKRIIKILTKIILIPFNKEKFIKKYMNDMKKYDYNSSNYVASVSWIDKHKSYIRKDVLDESEMKLFEGVNVRIPKKYDEYLKAYYGDYMQLPPEDKRISHYYKAWFE